jgi:hypothetical protein
MRTIVTFAFILLLFLGLLFSVNARITPHLPGGDDFRVAWTGARTFLFEHQNPYTADAAKDVQTAIYGHFAEEGEYPYRLDIPFHLLFLYFPFAFIKNFDLARALWLSFSEIAFFGVGFLSVQLTQWKPSRTRLALFFLALFLSFYGVASLSFGAQAIFTALIFLSALVAWNEKSDEALGILLLFGTFHLQSGGIVFFLFLFLLIAARRWRVLSVWLMGFIALLGVSFILLPDWVLPFFSSLRANLRAEQGLLLGETFRLWSPSKGLLAAQILKWAFLLLLIWEWNNARGKDFRHLLWVASLSLVLTPFLGVPLKATLYPFLFLPLVLVFKTARERWQRAEWLSVALLLLLLVSEIILWQFPRTYLLLAYLYPTLLLLALYWIRWWVVRPPRTWADKL